MTMMSGGSGVFVSTIGRSLRARLEPVALRGSDAGGFNDVISQPLITPYPRLHPDDDIGGKSAPIRCELVDGAGIAR